MYRSVRAARLYVLGKAEDDVGQSVEGGSKHRLVGSALSGGLGHQHKHAAQLLRVRVCVPACLARLASCAPRPHLPRHPLRLLPPQHPHPVLGVPHRPPRRPPCLPLPRLPLPPSPSPSPSRPPPPPDPLRLLLAPHLPLPPPQAALPQLQLQRYRDTPGRAAATQQLVQCPWRLSRDSSSTYYTVSYCHEAWTIYRRFRGS
ncbi:hypothetical protein L7F22_045405 [Adiantum nelumboides]|nr:hypothetical protein [Adiantum nelumboides]